VAEGRATKNFESRTCRREKEKEKEVATERERVTGGGAEGKQQSISSRGKM